MEIKTATSFASFLMALAAFNAPTATAANLSENAALSNLPTSTTDSTSRTSIDNRLARLTAALREREAQLSEESIPWPKDKTVAGWGNGRGGAWVNTRRGGWGDRSGGGGFANFNPWRNGWGDRGGFFNHNPWRNGGGGWLNRR